MMIPFAGSPRQMQMHGIFIIEDYRGEIILAFEAFFEWTHAFRRLLEKVPPVLDEKLKPEMETLRSLLDDPRGTGADRQMAVFSQTGSLDAVIRYLIEQTALGVGVEPGWGQAPPWLSL